MLGSEFYSYVPPLTALICGIIRTPPSCQDFNVLVSLGSIEEKSAVTLDLLQVFGKLHTCIHTDQILLQVL